MSTAYEDLLRIVETGTSPDLKLVAMRGFAEQLQWTPSYEFRASLGVDAASDHLVVEHGLENSAIITFLKAPYRASDLDASQLRSLLAISYNNLVEWHLFVSQTDIRQVNNLAESSIEPNADRIFPLTPSEFNQRLSSTAIDRLTGAENFRRTLRACDEALIGVISRWKRLLKADYPTANNANLSALFNALIFVRGCEDRNLDLAHRVDRALMNTLNANLEAEVNMSALLSEAMTAAGVRRPLSEYINIDELAPFDAIDRSTALNLCRDFYAPRDAAYDFNFALMSKHALSRIYERYVALLQPETENSSTEQLSFISPAPTDYAPARTGAVYTPQFVAGFFSRYVRDNVTPRAFRNLRIVDPACGSGIFLRTLLELQCNPTTPGTTLASIREAFRLAEGIDRDPNATAATRLSLALLHLVATGDLPNQLQIRTSNAIADANAGRIELRAYGAVMTNPPYIKLDFLSPADRETYREFMGGAYSGRLDAYIPFVKLCLEMAEVGGFVCMVLPQVFLNAVNAAPLRQAIVTDFDIRCLVDLSAVPVFEGVGAYSILLIVQRRPESIHSSTRAQVAQVTEFVGAALQACLDNVTIDTPYYRTFTVNQSFFVSKSWSIISPQHIAIEERISLLPKVSDYMNVVQGFLSGADDIFIIPRSEIPAGEQELYLDYLKDREILRYKIPTQVEQVVFYPYVGLSLVDEETLEARFPGTWNYLNRNRAKLESRGPVRAGKTPWWRPERPREPTRIRRPKIVCPHLMLTPRFALDSRGIFAVSHSPFLIAKDSGEEPTLLRLFTAVLNSSVCSWYMRTHAPKYAKGYNRLEANLLKAMPSPDVGRIDTADLQKILVSVDKLSSGKSHGSLDSEVDHLVAQLYGFTSRDRKILLGLD